MVIYEGLLALQHENSYIVELNSEFLVQKDERGKSKY